MLLIALTIAASVGSAAGAYRILARQRARRVDVLLGSYRTGVLVFVVLAPAAATVTSYRAALWVLIPTYLLWVVGVASAVWYLTRSRRAPRNPSGNNSRRGHRDFPGGP